MFQTLSPQDWSAIGLTAQLAASTTLVLLVLSTPLAWWLARTASRWRSLVAAVVAVPLVLPPTVLGFYLLILLGPQGWVGQTMQALGWNLLPFSFGALLVGSVVYSLPFAVQPLQHAFEAMGARPMEVAATLRVGPWAAFWRVAVPLARTGYVHAAVLSFAHTVGEFGVVLMLGGNIPGQTQVVSTQIYSHVEGLQYPQAHALSLGMVVFAVLVLWALHAVSGRRRGMLT